MCPALLTLLGTPLAPVPAGALQPAPPPVAGGPWEGVWQAVESLPQGAFGAAPLAALQNVVYLWGGGGGGG